jgi:hypothetical protein
MASFHPEWNATLDLRLQAQLDANEAHARTGQAAQSAMFLGLNRHHALAWCLSVISAQTHSLRLSRGKTGSRFSESCLGSITPYIAL